jgi:hypothetical protein
VSPTKRASGVPGLRSAIEGGRPMAAVQPASVPDAVPHARPPRPEKPVRFTLDLSRDQHRFLKEFALDTEADASVIMRALLTQLRDDPDLAQRVQAGIWQDRPQ